MNAFETRAFILGEGKGEVSTHYMMACKGSRSITPLIPNPVARWKLGVSIILRSSYHRVSTQHDTGCVPSRSGLTGEEKISYPHQDSNPGPSSYTDFANPPWWHL